jgi:hypothetical protein
MQVKSPNTGSALCRRHPVERFGLDGRHARIATGRIAAWRSCQAAAERCITFECLVDLAKRRWRIERDYQDLKQEVGLGHFEAEPMSIKQNIYSV